MESKYFLPRELNCRCKRKSCDAKQMDSKFLLILDSIREEYGDSIIVNSGVRCIYHNKRIGGSPKSQHLLGKAVDVNMHPKDLDRFLNICRDNGIKGVGIGNGWLHIDIRDGEEITWVY